MKAVIMAGGKGTRISNLFPDVPKPLIVIGGKPVLQREIENLASQGITDIILTVSHKGDQIREALGDGSRFGVHLRYFEEKTPMGNTGALFKMREELTETFLLLTADNVFDVDFQRMIRFHEAHRALITILARPTSHPYDCGLLETDIDGSVSAWYVKEDTKPEFYKNQVNSGIHLIEPEVLDRVGVDAARVGTVDSHTGEYCRVDLDRQLLRPFCGTHQMFCYPSAEYCRDMGTPERYLSVCRDFATGVFDAQRRARRKKCVFLSADLLVSQDRNGVLSLMPGAAQSLRRINRSAFYAAAILPHRLLGRESRSVAGRERRHRQIETLLGDKGAYLNRIYDEDVEIGFLREAQTLLHHADQTWLLRRAERDLRLDLESSWLLATCDTCIRIGKKAGCRTAKIGWPLRGEEDFSSLPEAVNALLAEEEAAFASRSYSLPAAGGF